MANAGAKCTAAPIKPTFPPGAVDIEFETAKNDKGQGHKVVPNLLGIASLVLGTIVFFL